MTKKHSKETAALRCELETYRKQGVPLWLDGCRSTPQSIEKAHQVAEDGVYMRDYVYNEKGEIEKLQFDLVKNT